MSVDVDALRERKKQLETEIFSLNRRIEVDAYRVRQEQTKEVSDLVDEIERLVNKATMLSEKYEIPLEINMNGSNYGDQLKYQDGYWNTSGMGC